MSSGNYRTLCIVFMCLNCFSCDATHRAKKHKKESKKYQIQEKIVGGASVPIEKYPFAAQFLNKGGLCGGVIIHSWAIITSAHCLAANKDIEEMMIFTGTTYPFDIDAENYNILHFVIHEDYSKKQVFSCDVALVFTEKPIKFGPRVQKAILVNHGKWMDEREDNFTVIGWGHTKEEGEISNVGLQMTHLKYLTSKECSKLHNDYKLTTDMFCLYGDGKRDACQGDSGGGVLWNGMLVGLTSHGDGCARLDKPSVYTNLWLLTNWIKKHILEFHVDFCKQKLITKGKNLKLRSFDSIMILK